MATPDTRPRASGKRTVLNWALALSTIIGALLIEAYAFMRVLGTAGCSDRACRGPSEFGYGLITYGAPVVALACVAISAVTARRPRGWVVPAVAWVLLIVAFIALVVTFRS